MSNIKREAVVLNLKYSKMPAEPKSERTPIFRNVHISGMTVTDVKTPIKIVGLEEAPISDIVLRDIHIQGGKQKCIFENCERITMDDVIVNGEVIKSTTDTTDKHRFLIRLNYKNKKSVRICVICGEKITCIN